MIDKDVIEEYFRHLRAIHFAIVIVSITMIVGLLNKQYPLKQVRDEYLAIENIFQTNQRSSQSSAMIDFDCVLFRAIREPKTDCDRREKSAFKIGELISSDFKEFVFPPRGWLYKYIEDFSLAKKELENIESNNFNNLSSMWERSYHTQLYEHVEIASGDQVLVYSPNEDIVFEEIIAQPEIDWDKPETYEGGFVPVGFVFNQELENRLEDWFKLDAATISSIIDSIYQNNFKRDVYRLSRSDNGGVEHIAIWQTKYSKNIDGDWLQQAFIEELKLPHPWMRSRSLERIFPAFFQFADRHKSPYTMSNLKSALEEVDRSLITLERESESKAVTSILGIQIPLNSIALYGSATLILGLLYFLAHLKEIGRLANGINSSIFPWMYLYRSVLSNCLRYFTLGILPPLAIIVGAYNLEVGWQKVVLYFIAIICILICIGIELIRRSLIGADKLTSDVG